MKEYKFFKYAEKLVQQGLLDETLVTSLVGLEGYFSDSKIVARCFQCLDEAKLSLSEQFGPRANRKIWQKQKLDFVLEQIIQTITLGNGGEPTAYEKINRILTFMLNTESQRRWVTDFYYWDGIRTIIPRDNAEAILALTMPVPINNYSELFKYDRSILGFMIEEMRYSMLMLLGNFSAAERLAVIASPVSVEGPNRGKHALWIAAERRNIQAISLLVRCQYKTKHKTIRHHGRPLNREQIKAAVSTPLRAVGHPYDGKNLIEVAIIQKDVRLLTVVCKGIGYTESQWCEEFKEWAPEYALLFVKNCIDVACAGKNNAVLAIMLKAIFLDQPSWHKELKERKYEYQRCFPQVTQMKVFIYALPLWIHNLKKLMNDFIPPSTLQSVIVSYLDSYEHINDSFETASPIGVSRLQSNSSAVSDLKSQSFLSSSSNSSESKKRKRPVELDSLTKSVSK